MILLVSENLILSMKVSFAEFTDIQEQLLTALHIINPFPVQFKTLLHGQKGCVFSAGI
jgi:hypothetical protein